MVPTWPRASRAEELKDNGNGIIDLPYDVISECSGKFESVLNPRVSLRYLVATTLLSNYRKVPSAIRNRLLSVQKVDTDLSRHLTTERARKILTDAVHLAGFHLQRKKPPALVITHDIDTERGFQKAPLLKKVEEDLGVESTWFLPSDEFPITGAIAAELKSRSVIGSHDIRHDGKLIHIDSHTELVRRLAESKVCLERIFDTGIECFRSPLLQFSGRILSGLNEAGYKHDFSLPCWEPMHPTTMGGFGIECTCTFSIDGIIEHPLTLFQDHQAFTVLRLNTRQTIKLWIKQAKLIRELSGDIVALVHPDYLFSQDIEGYRTLLTSLLEIHNSVSES
jgi:hypothetical protein